MTVQQEQNWGQNGIKIMKKLKLWQSGFEDLEG